MIFGTIGYSFPSPVFHTILRQIPSLTDLYLQDITWAHVCENAEWDDDDDDDDEGRGSIQFEKFSILPLPVLRELEIDGLRFFNWEGDSAQLLSFLQLLSSAKSIVLKNFSEDVEGELGGYADDLKSCGISPRFQGRELHILLTANTCDILEAIQTMDVIEPLRVLNVGCANWDSLSGLESFVADKGRELSNFSVTLEDSVFTLDTHYIASDQPPLDLSPCHSLSSFNVGISWDASRLELTQHQFTRILDIISTIPPTPLRQMKIEMKISNYDDKVESTFLRAMDWDRLEDTLLAFKHLRGVLFEFCEDNHGQKLRGMLDTNGTVEVTRKMLPRLEDRGILECRLVKSGLSTTPWNAGYQWNCGSDEKDAPKVRG